MKGNNPRKKRLKIIVSVFLVLVIAISLLLYAMQGQLNHFYSLESIAKKEVPIAQQGIRVGGMVANNSIKRHGESLKIEFAITDFKNPPLIIEYEGILPDLFREMQGIIAKGILLENGRFQASEILAKHDENYMPPELKEHQGKYGQ